MFSAVTLLQTTASLRASCTSLFGFTLTAVRSVCSAARKRRLDAFNAERKRQLQQCSSSIEKADISGLKANNTGVAHVVTDSGEYFASPHATINGKAKVQLLEFNNAQFSHHLNKVNISGLKANNTGVAHVVTDSGEYFASPHATINGKAKVQLLEFNNAQFSHHLNKAYWRSCAFLLGALAETSFRADVCIVDALPPNVESGRFVYVAEIKELHDWKPSKAELDILTRKVLRDFVYMALPFEPLIVPRKFAADLFAENPKKLERLRSGDSGEVTLYKVGEHVDVSEGPLIANTRQIGRFAVTGVDYVNSLYHFSGVSLPSIAKCTSYSWDLLIEAARLPPQLPQSESSSSSGDRHLV
ncbi:39S ribosomal protein L39, mitochondrial [Toxocara canis]|uniref:39S ribosomal protein L39, mitochondrial n=1 Tax=Toxocara canis TaxID=6265 RepID=A0A0B2VSM9_TOXCA|nr:39S ribosomal protein L39, mitochondrial [Toxocara canis]